MKQLRVLLAKELRQIRRNSFMPKLILGFPIMVMLILPLVTTMDVRHIGVGIVDSDNSTLSARIISHVSASSYFSIYQVNNDYQHMFDALNQGDIDVIVSIPPHFERSMLANQEGRISIDANAVNANKGTLGMQYILQTLRSVITEIRTENGLPRMQDPVVVQYRYNPTLNYKNYMIPALMIILLIMTGGFLPAINLVIEKEKGTIDQINVSPISKITFTLSKLIPFWIIGLIVLTIALGISCLIYGLIPAGQVWLIYLAAILFTFTMSGLAITIANFSNTMQQTMFMMFFFIIQFILMSGLLTPISSMPTWAQYFTYLLPPRYFIEIIRSVFLKASTFSDLSMNYLALFISSLLFNILAAVTYKKQE